MCGIAGFNWKDRRLGEKMGEVLSHRGPDASGIFEDTDITLVHRRLAIIDLSEAANQPMFDSTGRYAIVFNGEIYNYKELKKELGVNFRTESDTEVILEGYKKWGKSVVSKLNGIFAFAIWDKKEKVFFAARDHMGIKPFYYAWDGWKFIFASEIKAILRHDIPRTLNKKSFNNFLRVLYVPEPDTMISGVFKLPPGNFLTLKGTELRVENYYKPELVKKDWVYKDALNEVRQTITEAAQRQLIADVPVGVYLSGGIDSSVVLAAVSEVKKNVKTFSVGFDLTEQEGENKFNRDFELAQETSKHFGADHKPIKLSIKDVADNLEETIAAIDDPISNPTAVAMAQLARFAKREVTVVLSGDGGDELFGGYDRYRLSRIRDLLMWFPGLKGRTALDRLELFEFQKDPLLKSVISSDILEGRESIRKYFSKYVSAKGTEGLMMADLQSWLPDQALSLGDRMSMLGSLEQRVSFLDKEVIGLAMSLPFSYKVTPFMTKKILKEAFRVVLPEVLFNEPKRGWFAPGAKWLRRPEVLDIVKEVLNSSYYPPVANLFNWSEVEKMLEEHVSGKVYNLTMLWAILTFQIWAKKYQISL